MRVLGVDPGSRRIGLAVGDDEIGIASPSSTLEGGDIEKSARGLAAEAARLQVQKIVVGLPLRLDGGVGEAARKAQQLASLLRTLTKLEVVLWDERLTSKAAERALDAGGVRGAKRRKAVDPIAAALILQSYFDAERGRESNGSHA
jgi:putative Holliday junction resolvase